VVAIPVSGYIDRKNNPSHRPPYMTLKEKFKHRLIEFPITEYGGGA
jgi:hypothetical protein